jgi:hypothetical protein
MSFVIKKIRLIATCVVLGVIPLAHGESFAGLDFSGSGFLTLGAGVM